MQTHNTLNHYQAGDRVIDNMNNTGTVVCGPCESEFYACGSRLIQWDRGYQYQTAWPVDALDYWTRPESYTDYISKGGR